MFCKQNNTEEFDKQFSEIKSLKWLPWIGQEFPKNKRFIVLGESQYEDGHDWQENNLDATRTLIRNRCLGHRGSFYTKVEKVLLSECNPSLEQKNNLWRTIAYWNLVQRLMSSKKERPNFEDFICGWKVFFGVLETLKVLNCTIIVMGKSSFGPCGYFLQNKDTSWSKDLFDEKNKVIKLSKEGSTLMLVFINHPSGSYGFKWQTWADLLLCYEPSIGHALNSKN